MIKSLFHVAVLMALAIVILGSLAATNDNFFGAIAVCAIASLAFYLLAKRWSKTDRFITSYLKRCADLTEK